MRVSARIAVISVLAALSGWFVRGIQLEAEQTTAAPSTTTPPVIERERDVEAPEHVMSPAPSMIRHRDRRNLFAYASLPLAAPSPVVYEPVVRVLPPPAPIVRENPRPRFTYRYIGRFGPERHPIAAFSRQGEVVIVRAGERIDRDFVLRSIGVESVEVESVVDGEARTQRIAFDESM